MNQLPADLKRLIFEYVDDKELAQLCMLNKDFSDKVCNSTLWINKIINRFGLNNMEIQKFKHNNTVWAYYNYLVERFYYLFWNFDNIDKNKQLNKKLGNIERIYHHPEFQRQYSNMFNYYREPLNKKLFEKDFLYDLASEMLNLIDDIETDKIELTTQDINKANILMTENIVKPSPKLIEYIKSL